MIYCGGNYYIICYLAANQLPHYLTQFVAKSTVQLYSKSIQFENKMCSIVYLPGGQKNKTHRETSLGERS